MKSERALLLGPESKLRGALQAMLESHFCVDVAPIDPEYPSAAGRHSDQFIRLLHPNLVFIVLPNPLNDGTRLLTCARQWFALTPIIVAFETCESLQVLELLKLGAADFVTAPLKASEVLPRAWKLIISSDVAGAKPMVTPCPALKKIIGQSHLFIEQLRKIAMIAKCDANVLITGETGTGKELYARAIHYGSSRAGRPFVPINCGAIPTELIENELFGHERGAFTSASTLQSGLIEEANGGTLFLDEIDCLPLFAQAKCLRFLQEKEYRPLGSTKIRRADVRIIAASNLNLEEAAANGRLRQDLYYRLNIISLSLPPLRERRDDIPLLARHFLAKYAIELDRDITDLSEEAMQVLMVHNWPGNVRELEHVIERSIVLCDSSILQAQDLSISSTAQQGQHQSLQEAKAREIARFERNYIQGLLSACKGNITRAALVARKNRRAFWQLIQKHQIDVTRFKVNSERGHSRSRMD